MKHKYEEKSMGEKILISFANFLLWTEILELKHLK